MKNKTSDTQETLYKKPFLFDQPETWPEEHADCVFHTPDSGTKLGTFYIEDGKPRFGDWHNRTSNEPDASYNLKGLVTWYIVI